MLSLLRPLARRTGVVFFATAPLTLAFLFYGLSTYVFGRHIGLEGTSLVQADGEAIATAGALVTARSALETARTALAGTVKDDKGVAAQRVANAEAVLKAAQAAVDRQSPSATSRELATRLWWGTAGACLSFLLALVSVQAVRGIYRARSWTMPPVDAEARGDIKISYLASLVYALAAVGVAGWVGWREWAGGSSGISSSIGGTAAAQLLQTLQGGPAAALLGLSPGFSPVPRLGWLIVFMNAGVFFALTLVALSVSIVVGQLQAKLKFIESRPVAARVGKDDVADTRWLQTVTSSMTPLMQLTAVTLIAGVVEVFLLYLTVAHHVRPTLQPDVRHFAQTIAAAGGVVYSGILVAIYLPLYDVLKALGAGPVLGATAAAAGAAQTPLLQTSGPGDRPVANPGAPVVSAPARAVAPAPVADVRASTASFDVFGMPLLKSTLTLLAPVLTAVLGVLVGGLKDILLGWAAH